MPDHVATQRANAAVPRAAGVVAPHGPREADPGPALAGVLGRLGVARLQALAGNRATTRALRAGPAVQRVISTEQADRVAHLLLDAMDRLGTDEEAIYGALSGRGRADLHAIVAAYQPISMNGSLDADLRDELTEDELARARGLMASAEAESDAAAPEEALARRGARAQEVARQLDEAMRGLGTDESQLINSLTGRSPHEIVEIARAYHELTGRPLVDDVRDELSGEDLDTAMGLVRTMHAEGDGPHVEIGMIQQALNALGATPPLRITAMFGPETTAALSAFQAAHPPLEANGRATLETWLELDELAPRVVRSGRIVVESGTPEARGPSTTGTVHPTIRLTNRGPAVEELQQKLLTIDATDVPTRPTATGRFDAPTRRAVREFQGSRTPPLPVTGVADAATWTALDAAAGPVTVGREDFESFERVEGTVYGGPTRFTWRIHPDRFEVTVNIRFTGAPSHPRVAVWRQQMMDAWNTFKLVDDDHPGTELPLRFVVGSGSPADATVRVVVTPVGEEPERSNAGTYHTGDTDPALAPHEFGHLLGLQDEYNTGPEQYTIITGEQPFVGRAEAPTDDSGAPVAPETIAAEIRTAVTSSPTNQRGTKAEAVVLTKYGLRQGAFAQRVGIAYERANAGNLKREDLTPAGRVVVDDPAAHIEDDIAARIPGQTGPEVEAVRPFGYSNRSLMGESQSFNAPISEHDHPIAERHVRHFAEVLGRNRPGAWRVMRG